MYRVINMAISQESITEFFKKYFSQMRKELENGEEVMLVPDETFDQDDIDVINYLEFNCISYSNEEILKMLDS